MWNANAQGCRNTGEKTCCKVLSMYVQYQDQMEISKQKICYICQLTRWIITYIMSPPSLLGTKDRKDAWFQAFLTNCWVYNQCKSRNWDNFEVSISVITCTLCYSFLFLFLATTIQQQLNTPLSECIKKIAIKVSLNIPYHFLLCNAFTVCDVESKFA